MVRNHIDVNSVPLYSTIYTCDFVRLIIQQQPITFDIIYILLDRLYYFITTGHSAYLFGI